MDEPAEQTTGLSWWEVSSKLFGWWSLGLAAILFFPEIWETVRTRPKKIRPDTYGFYWSWLIGDGGQIIGLYLAGGLITQKALTWTICVADVIMIFLLSLFSGMFVCRPCRNRTKRNRTEMKTVRLLGLSTSVAPVYEMPPPGWTDVGGEIVKSFPHRKKWTQKRNETVVKLARHLNSIVVGITLLIMTGLWIGLDVVPRKTADPDPVSHPPEGQTEIIAYVLSWAGLPCWLGPRVYNVYRSKSIGLQEGITTSAVVIGAASHICNIVSIVLVNHTGDTILGQLPYLLTAIFCGLFDFYRLRVKKQLQGTPYLPPPGSDREWLRRQEGRTGGISAHDVRHGNYPAASVPEVDPSRFRRALARVPGGRRTRDVDHSPAASSGEEEGPGHSPSALSEDEKDDLAARRRYHSQAALLPMPFRKDPRWRADDPKAWPDTARRERGITLGRAAHEHLALHAALDQITDSRRVALAHEAAFAAQQGLLPHAEKHRRLNGLRQREAHEVDLQHRAKELVRQAPETLGPEYAAWEAKQNEDPRGDQLQQDRDRRNLHHPLDDYGLFHTDSGHGDSHDSASTDIASGLWTPGDGQARQRSRSRGRR
ncbi:hypothetical protein JCM10213v2_009286 [Rhodosporidiobolus nylandii]